MSCKSYISCIYFDQLKGCNCTFSNQINPELQDYKQDHGGSGEHTINLENYASLLDRRFVAGRSVYSVNVFSKIDFIL